MYLMFALNFRSRQKTIFLKNNSSIIHYYGYIKTFSDFGLNLHWKANKKMY